MIRIYTVAANRPDFIELQAKTFQKYLGEDYEFTVLNNANFDRERYNYESIKKECRRYDITSVDVERDDDLIRRCQGLEDQVDRGYGVPPLPLFGAGGTYSNCNIALAYALCWAWARIISRAVGPICLIDSDAFLVEPLCLTDYLREQPLCYVPMHRPGGIEYMWTALVLADLSRLPEPEALNWWCGQVDGQSVDVGGQTYTWLRAHHEVRRKYIRPERIGDEGEKGHELLRLDNKKLLHYLRGSNWNSLPEEYHRQKTAWLRGVLGI